MDSMKLGAEAETGFMFKTEGTKILCIFLTDITVTFWNNNGGILCKHLREIATQAEEIVLVFGKFIVDIMPFLKICITISRLKAIRSGLQITFTFDKENTNFFSNGYYVPLLDIGRLQINCNPQKYCKISNRKELAQFYQAHSIERDVKKSRALGKVIIPTTILAFKDNSSEFEIRETLQKKIYKLNENLTGLVENATIDRISSTLEIVITELVLNVYEHAYPQDSCKYVGIYLRYRRGLSDSKRTIIKEEYNREQKTIPELDPKRAMEQSSGFIELYVVDCGQGFIESVCSDNALQSYRQYNYPIREILRDIFEGTLRRRNRQSKVKSTLSGLNYIQRMLRANENVIWLATEQHFFHCGPSVYSTQKPSDAAENGGQFVYIFKQSSSELIDPGVSICVRIKCNKVLKISAYCQNGWNGTGINPAISAYRIGNQIINFDSQLLCIDQCQTQLPTLLQKNYQITAVHSIDEVPPPSTFSQFVWLPPKNSLKNEIFRMVNTLLDKNYLTDNQAVLVIGDVKELDLISIYHAIQNFDIDSNYEFSFSKIIAISDRWQVSCFIRGGSRYCYSSEESKAYYSKKFDTTKMINIGNSLGEYAYFIRLFDSGIFWKYVLDHSDSNYYIPESINWSENMVLSGYLSFDTILCNTTLFSILVSSLQRFCNLFGSEISLQNLDVITEELCNCIKYTNNPLSQYHISTGSVLVTGYTLRDFQESTTAITIHFFIHPDCSTKEILDGSLLFWLAGEICQDMVPTWERLGKTHLIGRINSGSKISTKLLKNKRYYQTISEIQHLRYPLLNWGHIVTPDNHYLLFALFYLTVEDSYFSQSGLSLYLIKHIWGSLTDQEQRKNYYNKYRGKAMEFSNWIHLLEPAEEELHCIEKTALIIYILNQENEKIVQLLKKALPPDLHDKFIPLTIYKIHQRSSLLNVAPVLLEQIHQQLGCDTFNSNKVSLFDAVLQTGKTITEIDDLMNSIQGTLDHVITILDCMILDSHYTTYAYWKIQIPRLGSANECPLCQLLHITEEIKSDFLEEYAARVGRWKELWKPETFREYSGLSKLRNAIFTEDQTSHLKQKYPELGNCEIQSVNVLCICLGELLCTSFHNNIVDRLCKDTELNLDYASKILLTAFQILIFGTPSGTSLCENLIGLLIENMMLLDEKMYPELSILGALAIINQDMRHLDNVIPTIIQDESLSQNLDLKIVMAYSIKHSPKISQWAHDTIAMHRGASGEWLREIINNLSISLNDKDIGRRLHGKLYNEYNKDHQTIFEKFKSTNINVEEQGNRYSRLISTIQDVNLLFSQYGSGLKSTLGSYSERFENVEQPGNCFETYVNYSKQVISAVRTELEKLPTLNNKENAIVPSELTEAVQKLYDLYKSMHRYYFIGNDIKSQEIFRKYLEQQVATFKKNHQDYDYQIIIADFNAEDRNDLSLMNWYFWNGYIETELYDLIDNVRFSKEKFKYECQEVNMVIFVRFQSQRLVLQLLDLAEEQEIRDAKNMYLRKPKLSKEQNNIFGVTVKFSKRDSSIKLSPPPAHKAYLEVSFVIPAVFPKVPNDDDINDGENQL